MYDLLAFCSVLISLRGVLLQNLRRLQVLVLMQPLVLPRRLRNHALHHLIVESMVVPLMNFCLAKSGKRALCSFGHLFVL